MKIFRSPIEPDFIAYLKFSWRIKRASILAQIKALYRTFALWYQRKEEKVSTWLRAKNELLSRQTSRLKRAAASQATARRDQWQTFQTKVTSPVRQSIQSVEKLRQTDYTRLADDFMAPAEELTAKAAHALKGSTRSLFLGVLVVGFLAGGTAKIIARDSTTIGFEDYKVTAGGRLDLNAIQKKVLASGGSLAIESAAYAGEQCTE